MPFPDPPADDCLAGGGEIAALMRSVDWSATPLGPVASWSLALRTMVRLLLVNRFQLFLWWGPRYVQFYNDAARPILGAKHPRSLGQPAAECWSEIWHVIGPLIDTPFRGGPATWQEDIFLEINRYGTPEETHFTIAYSPVPDDSVPGGIGGVFGTVHEITEKVVGERRVVVLRDLGARAAEAKTAGEACATAAWTLAAHDKDIPFALIYLLDREGKHVELAAASGVAEGEAISPRVIGLEGDGRSGWPLAEAIVTYTTQVVSDLSARFGRVPPGPWSDLPTTAVVLPIPSTRAHEPAGLLVAGVSARLRLDEQYRGFLELVAGQIGTAVGNARAYEEEKRRAEALAELDRAKTAFFSNVSHEFRTPLTLILGPVEDAIADPADPLPARQRERLETAHRSSLRLLKLVNTLLDFSRIEAGRVQAAYEPTDLAALTAELASTFRSACDKAGLRLVVDCPTLPEPVYVDREMWEKVVLNLLSNAFKFTLEGEIAVRLRAVGGAAELAVRDTGTGIPAEELPRVFERFHRVEGSRGRTHEGTGIGLALVQELVKLHGGSVRAESTPGIGSTFLVSVPTGTAQLPADRIGAARTLGPTAVGAGAFIEEALRWLPDQETSRSFPGSVGNAREAFPPEGPALRPPTGTPEQDGGAAPRPRILWADDNADMRDYVRRLLGERYDVEAVPDGEAALDAARARPPDLVLTDVMMPRLDGFGLLNALRVDPATRTIPVILLSARAGEESRVEGLEAGADDYLVKPFSARELLARVGANLEMARVRRKSERRVTRILESISDGFIAFDRDWQYTALNDRAAESMGMSRDDILGRRIWELYPDTVGTRFEAELYRAVAEQKTVVFEYFYPTRNLWYENRVHPSADGVSIFFADITNRKRSEEALRESEARLDLAMRGSNIGIWDLDLAPGGDYRRDPVRFINVWEPLGYDPAEFPADAVASRMLGHPDDLVRVDAAVAACLAGETAEIRVENRIRHKDGSYRWLLTIGRAMRDEAGTPVRLIGTVLDITARKQAEEVLRENEERMAADLAAMTQLQKVSTRLVRDGDSHLLLLEIVDAAIAITAADMGNIQLYDPASDTLRIVAARGFQPEDLRTFGIVRRGQATCGTALVEGKRVVVGDVTTSPIFVGQPILGAMLCAGIRAAQSTPLVGRSGRMVGMLSTHYRTPRHPAERDFHVLDLLARQAADWIERARGEEELRQAKEAAEAANRAKDEFLANVSHEIRTPFGAILGMAELVLDTPLTDDQRQCLDTVKSAAEQLLGLVDALLDFSRTEAGKLALEPVPFSLRGAVGDAIRSLDVQARRKGLELTSDVHPGVPDALVGDVGRLRQVLLNLVGNAIKFTQAGAVAVRVEPAATPVRGEAVVSFAVTDTGIGIPRDGRERIFQAFEQADTSTTRKYGGTGLGLTIAARLVALMGGTITVESELGRGSTFAFTARFGYPPPTAEPAGAPDVTQPAPRHAVAARILVAEDDEFNSRHLERLLGRAGHRVRLATNGREALALLGIKSQGTTDRGQEAGGAASPTCDSWPPSPDFDLVLLDLHMPDLDGFQVVRAVRERERVEGGHLPVIALTARSRKEDRDRCLEAGMDGFFAKPVRPAELLAAIDRAVTGKRRVAPPARPDLLDAAVLLAASGGDPVGLRELCQDLRTYARARLAEVGDALWNRDAPRLREAAHKLCGLLSAFSTAAGSVASDVEDHAAGGRLEAAAPLVERLEGLVHALLSQTEVLSLTTLRARAAPAD